MPQEQLADEVYEENVRLSKWQIFGYLFVVPLIFTLLLTAVLGSALGIVDLSQQLQGAQKWAHDLPVVGAWIPEPEDSALSSMAQQRQEILAEWNMIEEARARNDQAARDVAEREKRLAEATQRFNQIQQERQNREKQIENLVAIYSTMKAEAAALIFNELKDISEEAAVEVLAGMDVAKSNRILAAMNPAKAAKLTQLMRR